MNLKQYSKCKESGLEYIGKIPEHWEILPLKRLSKRIVVGIAEATTQSYVDKGVPLLRSTNIKSGIIDTDDLLYIDEDFAKKNSSKYLYSNDLLTVRTGNAGQTAVVPNSLNKSQCFTMLITTLEKNYNPSFYNYFLNSLSGISYFDVTAWGTAQKNISVPILKECLVPILPLAEQDIAVKYLDSQTLKIDNAIDKDKQLIELLEEKRIALINQTVTRELDPEAVLQDSGIEWMGKIPSKWTLRRIRFNCQVNPKHQKHVSDKNQTVSFLPMEKVSTNGEIDHNSNVAYWEVSSGYTYFENKDIILAKITPCFENGKGAMVDHLLNGFGFGTTEFHVLRANENVEPKFLYYFTHSHLFRVVGEAFMEGAAGQKRISAGFVKDFFMPTPPTKAEQIQISTFLDSETAKTDKLIKKIEKRIRLLEEYKKAIINNVVTGKTDVRDQNGLSSKVFS
jgi:type I restriction enzyme S subunit